MVQRLRKIVWEFLKKSNMHLLDQLARDVIVSVRDGEAYTISVYFLTVLETEVCEHCWPS